MSDTLRGLQFQSPARFVFGFGVASQLAAEVEALGGRRPLVVTKRSMVERGDVAPALRSLDDAGIEYIVYDGILPDAPIHLVDEALELLGTPTTGASDDAAAALSVAAVEGLLDRVGAAHRLRDYGIRTDQIPRVADLSWGQIGDFLESNARPFGREDVEGILRDAY